MFAAGMFFGVIFGAGMMVLIAGPERFVINYKDPAKPYCISQQVADKTYTRCWFAQEVKP